MSSRGSLPDSRRWRRRFAASGVFDAVSTGDTTYVLSGVSGFRCDVRQLFPSANRVSDGRRKLLAALHHRSFGPVEVASRGGYGVGHVPSVADQHVAIHSCHLDETAMLRY